MYFGRDAPIVAALDEIRRMRAGASERILVIPAASGAGKSSFLRAGIIARLERDSLNFIVLPVMRPLTGAIDQFLEVLASRSSSTESERSEQCDAVRPEAGSVKQLFQRLRAPVVERATKAVIASDEPFAVIPPTIVIALDQTEELFAPLQTQRADFLALLASLIEQDRKVLLIATVRIDALAAFQSEPSLSSTPQTLFTLPAIPAGTFKEIIEKPAALASPKFQIEPALTQALLEDLNVADALPLLSFTLMRLHSQGSDGANLTLDAYRRLGGFSGVIRSAFDAVLGEQPSKQRLAVARRLFVPALVQVDHNGVKKRVARRSEIDPDALKLADEFVVQRVFTTGDDQIEVSHEAILRLWPTLAEWISEERDALQALESVRRSALEWEERGRSTGWLTHRGARLALASKVIGRKDFAAFVEGPTEDYLAACHRSLRRSRGAVMWATTAIAVLLIVAFAGGLASFASASIERRRNVANELAQQWTSPKMTTVASLAQQQELIAAELSALQNDIGEAADRLAYAELALQTHDADLQRRSSRAANFPAAEWDDEPDAVEQRVSLADDLDHWRGVLMTLRLRDADLKESFDLSRSRDATVAVALFWARVYEVTNSNTVDRSQLARVLGRESLFWAGTNRLGASFVGLEELPGDAATTWLRERAVLGAHIVANDYSMGAPESWSQLVGLNESGWQRAEQDRPGPPP